MQFILILLKVRLSFLFKISLLVTSFSCVAADNYRNSALTSDLKAQTVISTEFSFGGIELKFSNFLANQLVKDTRANPEISLISSFVFNPKPVRFDKSTSTVKFSTRASFNRYKNTVPIVFQLTLKGYSIMEYSNYQTDTWSLNKSDIKAFRKPEIMFSLTKYF